MTEMEERVAAAIMRAYFSRPVDEQTGINVSVADQADLARAAIEAMREPTEAMVSAAYFKMLRGRGGCWRAMIDAALGRLPP